MPLCLGGEVPAARPFRRPDADPTYTTVEVWHLHPHRAFPQTRRRPDRQSGHRAQFIVLPEFGLSIYRHHLVGRPRPNAACCAVNLHRKEDSQYHPHNLIPAITDVANRWKSCRLRCACYLFIRSATAPSVGLQLAMAFGLQRSAQNGSPDIPDFVTTTPVGKKHRGLGLVTNILRVAQLRFRHPLIPLTAEWGSLLGKLDD